MIIITRNGRISAVTVSFRSDVGECSMVDVLRKIFLEKRVIINVAMSCYQRNIRSSFDFISLSFSDITFYYSFIAFD